MSGIGLTLGFTRDNEIGQDGIIGLQSPADVPEVASGYWWHPSMSTGFGTTGFRVVEGNGHSTVDLVQATVAAQPTILTENGQTQFRMRKRTDLAPSLLVTGAALQAGWTTATYVAGWFRLPDAAGIVTVQDYLFRHYEAAGKRRWNSSMLPAPISNLVLQASSDGTANALNRFDNANIFAGGGWVWVEHFFDPLQVTGGTAPADNLRLATNFTLRAVTSTMGTLPTSLFNGNSLLAVAGTGITLVENTDTTDWSGFYYANGIPSLGNRIALSRWRAPV